MANLEILVEWRKMAWIFEVVEQEIHRCLVLIDVLIFA